jgi:hypothetical protein
MRHDLCGQTEARRPSWRLAREAGVLTAVALETWSVGFGAETMGPGVPAAMRAACGAHAVRPRCDSRPRWRAAEPVARGRSTLRCD